MSWDSDTKENDVCKSTWEQLKSFRVNHKKQMIFGHLNINGLRKKFFEFKDMLADNVIDNVFLSENKLDESFPTPQFNVNGFSHHRNDRNGHGGGLAAHSRSDIPHRRRTDYESKANDGVEFIIFDVIIRHGKWLFIGVYKPPSVHDDHLIESMTNVFRQTQGAYRSTFVIGDINIDMLKAPKQFQDFMHIYGLENVIIGPICFKAKNATQLDVVLTDTPRRIEGIVNFDIDMSDFHNITCASTRLFVPKTSGSSFHYRSYKKFDDSQLKKDLMYVPFQVAEIFDDIHDSFDFTNKLLTDVVNEHAPLKTGRRRYNHAPFMHGELRKAVNVKGVLKRRYDKNRNSANWENYRRQRNLVSKLRAQAINTYFHENCRDVSNKKFWNIIKPFMSSSNKDQNARICLFENNRIVNDDSEACDIFNSHFASIGNDVGGRRIDRRHQQGFLLT